MLDAIKRSWFGLRRRRMVSRAFPRAPRDAMPGATLVEDVSGDSAKSRFLAALHQVVWVGWIRILLPLPDAS